MIPNALIDQPELLLPWTSMLLEQPISLEKRLINEPRVQRARPGR
jgi:hypothetical protein